MAELSPLSNLLFVAGDAAYDWDVRSNQLQWFGAHGSLFGVVVPESSESFFDVIFSEDRPLVFAREDEVIDRQYRVRRADGDLIWVHERGHADIVGGKVVRRRGVLRIIEKSTERSSRDVHGHDTLTGCFNRTYMLEHLSKEMEVARNVRRAAAYLVLGIDKMSFVNEAVGMEAGDALLRGVADRLTQIMPPRSVLGRVGGDMFGILLPEPLGNDFRMLAGRILQSFRDQPVVTSVTPLHITVSIGGARLPDVAKSATEAMIFAEQALHDAHQRGRNLFIEYLDSPERVQENRQLLELGERIKHAFKNDGFRLAYQPVIKTATGQVLFYEALVRMFDDAGNPIAAAQFVPAIEQLGLAFELDRRVMDLAIKELENYPALCLAINVSGLTAAQADWPEYVQNVLGHRPDISHRVIIEITETAAIVDLSETHRFVEQICELGGRVALDDFGAGFTSIRHLRSLSLSIMKIDKDLLHNVITNAEQQHLVRMLIELARGLGLETVAEGVETNDVADWLRSEKVDMMQGYYFGKPTLDRPWVPKPLAGDAAVPQANLTTSPAADKPLSPRAALCH
jgi:diguanylate cyclase (GGDEF)-like protein